MLRALISFSEDLGAFGLGEELEAGFGEFADVFHGRGNLDACPSHGFGILDFHSLRFFLRNLAHNRATSPRALQHGVT